LGAVHGIRYSLPVIDTLHGEFEIIDAAAAPRHRASLPFKRSLTLDQVSFRYPAAETHALRDVSLSIPRGASIGFIGGSGAGKSTLVDIVLGLLTPAGGTVKVDDVDIDSSLRSWQDQIGYVPQSIYLTDDSLRR